MMYCGMENALDTWQYNCDLTGTFLNACDPLSIPFGAICDDPGVIPSPTSIPTIEPTTSNPSSSPTTEPTYNPNGYPTTLPSTNPTSDPTTDPTMDPTSIPSAFPTIDPTYIPTNGPTANPTELPSNGPSASPTVEPTVSASPNPSVTALVITTKEPTNDPSEYSSEAPAFNSTIVQATATNTSISNVDVKQLTLLPSHNTTSTVISVGDISENSEDSKYVAIALSILAFICVIIIVMGIIFYIRKSQSNRNHKKLPLEPPEDQTANIEMGIPNLPESDDNDSQSNVNHNNDVPQEIMNEMYSIIRSEENDEGPKEGCPDHDMAVEDKEIVEWNVYDVLSWLLSINNGKLENYVPIFRENAINGTDLKRLNDDYLKRLGITRFFDRVDILKERDKLLREESTPYL